LSVSETEAAGMGAKLLPEPAAGPMDCNMTFDTGTPRAAAMSHRIVKPRVANALGLRVRAAKSSAPPETVSVELAVSVVMRIDVTAQLEYVTVAAELHAVAVEHGGESNHAIAVPAPPHRLRVGVRPYWMPAVIALI